MDDFEKNLTELTAVKYMVPIKEIAIELWHQIVCVTNEYLVQIGFVQEPINQKGEGMYLKSFSVSD